MILPISPSRGLVLLLLSMTEIGQGGEQAEDEPVGGAQQAEQARVRRQTATAWQCPASTATTRSSRMLAYLAVYSASTRQDANIYQARKAWNAIEVDRQLSTAGFDLRKPTLIYTHGYTQTINRPWLVNIRRNYDELVASKDGSQPFNLLLFDWSEYGQKAYGTAVSYVPYLGTLLSQFIGGQLGERYNYSASQVHIVSYSLSTHIAGQTGRKLKAVGNPLAQITAIDPTGVCFHTDAKFALKYQLKPDDAKLVVARHYDMGTLGSRRPIGGVDVFVNGGTDQPSMSLRGQYSPLSLLSALGSMSNHQRASLHEAEQSDPTCQEVAYACRSYAAFQAGECADCGQTGNKCLRIGTLTNALEPTLRTTTYKLATKMYTSTGRDQFCVHHYQILAKLKKKATKADRKAIEAGELSATLSQDNGPDGIVRATPKNRQANDQYTELLQLNSKLGPLPDQIQVNTNGKFKLNSLESLKITYMSNISAEERRKNSARFCPRGDYYLVKC